MSDFRARKERKMNIKYTNIKGFTLCQQNGQRTYGGPPPNWGNRPPPSRDCEVFIGRLPRMCFEDELIPLFLTAGELYEFRLMLDFSGTNRGYGYAHYATPEGAANAIEKLNKYEIRPGHQIGVLKSKNNCRLLFGNIAASLSLESFNDFIRTVTDQVLNVLMFNSFEELRATDFSISTEMEEAFLGRMPFNNRNNRFAIVEYENHKAAAVARRVLIPKFGHILAIDWAVPPRERKRGGGDSHAGTIERPLPNSVLKDTTLLSSTKTLSKVRPVPVLIVQSSPLDNVTFMPKTFQMVVKFFKYLLSVCLYRSVDQLEIPLFVCKEIERKIVDRITNLENCSQAVQLIFNYFSWYNEKKRFIIHSDVQKLMEEIKAYADLFVQFVNKRLKFGPSSNIAEDYYYINILPLHLNILFRIILRSDGGFQGKLLEGIAKSLQWLSAMLKSGNESVKMFLEEIFHLIENEDGTALDKASNIAKSLFLNSVSAQTHPQCFSEESFAYLSLENKNGKVVDSGLECDSEDTGIDEQFSGLSIHSKIPDDQIVQKLKAAPLVSTGRYEEATFLPPVPLLLVQPSIMNNVPFMPKYFNNIIPFFKHLIKLAVCSGSWEMRMPQQIVYELERKIIDRISNMANCGEGIQIIINYCSIWIEKKSVGVNPEMNKTLQEIKAYADSFVNFVWNKTLSGYQLDPETEKYFCELLPLRLNILFHMTLIFNADRPVRFTVGIFKGLTWIDDIIRQGDKTAKDFIDEVTRFIIDPISSSYDKVKALGRAFYLDSLNPRGQLAVSTGPTYLSLTNGNSPHRTLSCSPIASVIASSSASSSSSTASSSTFPYENSLPSTSGFEH